MIGIIGVEVGAQIHHFPSENSHFWPSWALTTMPNMNSSLEITPSCDCVPLCFQGARPNASIDIYTYIYIYVKLYMCIYHIETSNKIQASNSREKIVISPKKKKRNNKCHHFQNCTYQLLSSWELPHFRTKNTIGTNKEIEFRNSLFFFETALCMYIIYSPTGVDRICL